MISIAGRIPIRIHPLFFLMAAMIGFFNSGGNLVLTLFWMVIIIVSVLIHELGHALTAILFGQKVRIDFVALGGITSRSSDESIKLWQEFLIVLNGPLAGFCLAFVCMFLYPWFKVGSLLYIVLDIGMYVNFFWTFVNLLPVHPLDGGHLLRIILEGAFGYRGVKIAALLSVLFAACAAAIFFMMNAILPGVLFVLFAFEGWRMWQTAQVMTASDRDSHLQSLFREAEKKLAEGHLKQGLADLEVIRTETKKGMLFLAATQEMAKIHQLHREDEKVYQLLHENAGDLDPDMRYLLFEAAYRTQRWEVVAALGDELYTVFPTEITAIMNAEAHAALGDVEPAIGWLDCARVEGFTDFGAILQRPAFDKIRHDPVFQRKTDQDN